MGDGDGGGVDGASGDDGDSGGVAGSPGGDDTPVSDDPDSDSACVCEPAGYGFCQPQVLPCESDDDCEDGLVCGDSPSADACGVPVPSPLPGAESGAAGSLNDGCQVDGPKQCLPRYYNLSWGGGSADAVATAEVARAGSDPTTPGNFNSEAQDDSDDSDPANLQDVAASGQPSGNAGTLGCQVGSGRAPSQLAWLGLPLLLLRRRRTQR